MTLWSLNALVLFWGLVLELGVIWLLLAQTRLPLPMAEDPLAVTVSLARSAFGLLLLAFIVQVVALAFLPSWPVANAWFILAAAFGLLPARLLRHAIRQGGARSAPISRASGPSVEKPRQTSLDFNQRLERVQQAIIAHPEGVTLVQLGAALGVEWRQLTGVARELLRRGLVEKDGKLYRPRPGR